MLGHISTLVWTRFFLLKKTQLCCCSLRLPQLSGSLMASVICVSHPSRFVFGFRFWIVLLCLCVCDSVVVFVCVIVWTRFNNGFMYLWMSSIWVPSSFNFFFFFCFLGLLSLHSLYTVLDFPTIFCSLFEQEQKPSWSFVVSNRQICSAVLGTCSSCFLYAFHSNGCSGFC